MPVFPGLTQDENRASVAETGGRDEQSQIFPENESPAPRVLAGRVSRQIARCGARLGRLVRLGAGLLENRPKWVSPHVPRSHKWNATRSATHAKSF